MFYGGLFMGSGVTSHIAGNDRLRGFCLDVERTLFLVQADFSHGIGQDRVVPRVKTIGTCQKWETSKNTVSIDRLCNASIKQKQKRRPKWSSFDSLDRYSKWHHENHQHAIINMQSSTPHVPSTPAMGAFSIATPGRPGSVEVSLVKPQLWTEKIKEMESNIDRVFVLNWRKGIE